MNVDVAIVGAGIGGMALALELLERGVVPRTVALFDRSSDSRGRLETVTTRSGVVCELGPARFHPVLHPRLANLTQRFEVELGRFHYRTVYDASVREETLSRFRELDLDSIGPAQSFIEALGSALGDDDADLFCSLIGYGALRDRRFPVEGGVELVRIYPESFQSSAFVDGWQRPRHGFRDLAEQMQTFLASAGFQFHYGMDALEIVEDGSVVILRFGIDGGSSTTVRARSVVLAIPPGSLLTIKHQWTSSKAWMQLLHEIPEFKCFLNFNPALWPFGEENVCMITRTDLQKLYLDRDRASAYFFCDSDATERWHSVVTDGVSSLLAEAQTAVEDVVGRVEWGGLADVVWKCWRPGVTFFSGETLGTADYVELSGRAFMIGDAFTPLVGWIEGALTSASSVAERVL